MVELRLDTMDRPDPDAALVAAAVPRSSPAGRVREGGHFDGCEEERRDAAERASELGAEFIDVEWDAGFDA